MKDGKGLPIGRYTSQPLANVSINAIDHAVKERLRVRHYFRYCDDTTSLFRTKREAREFLKEFDRICLENGLLVKHDAIIARIGNGSTHGRHRKRMRSHTRSTKKAAIRQQGRQKHQLSRLRLQRSVRPASQEHQDALRKATLESSPSEQ